MYRLCLILICIICISCDNNTAISPELSQAESLMQSAPDSALAILKHIPTPENLTPLNYNTWNLLITQAENKNRIKATTDERIKLARTYFDRTDNLLRKAQCNFYAGQVALDLNKPDSAAVGYLRAIDLLEGTNHYDLIGLAHHSYGVLCKMLNDHSLAVAHWNKALVNFRKEGNKLHEIYALRDVARGWYNLGEKDSADSYYNRALQLSLSQNDSLLIFSVYNSLSSYYKYVGQLDSSMYFVHESIRYNTIPAYLDGNYLIKGRLFMQMNKYDSAFIYFEKAELSDNLTIKCGAYNELANFYDETGDLTLSNQYLRKYIDSKLKLADMFQQSKIKEIESLYNNERLLRANEQVESKNVRLLIILFSISLSFVFVLIILGIVVRNRKKELNVLTAQLSERKKQIATNQKQIDEISKHLSFVAKYDDMEISEVVRQSIRMLQTERDRLFHENAALMQKREDDLKRYKVLQKSNKKLSATLIDKEDLLTRIKHMNKKKYSLAQINEELELEVDRLCPNFSKRLNKRASKMNDKDKFICYMLYLNYSNAEIAEPLSVLSQTVSQYKSAIVKEYFKQEGTPIEDILLFI